MKKVILATLSMFLLFSCNKEEFSDIIGKLGGGKESDNPREGFVYTMSNETGGNSILVYNQKSNGTLSYLSSIASGGIGTGSGLGSEGSVTIDAAHKWLFAVNAGSNSVSSFKINNEGTLTLVHTVSSNGTLPISVTTFGNWLYVVNSTTSNISGYTIGAGGTLTPIGGSTQPLSAANAGPAQISFVPCRQKLIVTEKNTNMITSYPVSASGVAAKGSSIASAGQTPYGFDFSGCKYAIISEAWGGMANASTVSAYSVSGSTTLASGPVASKQTAACWAKVTSNGQYAYVANTKSNNISLYQIGSNGTLQLLNAAEAATGTNPSDLVLSGNGFYLYSLNTGSHTISEFKKGNNESLKGLGQVTNLPAYAVGLAAF